jgi:hypothetical protein
MEHLSTDEQQLLTHLIRSTGRDPGHFRVTLEPDGFVRIVGPRGTACYLRENWFTRFSRHLDRSFFDAGLPASRPRIARGFLAQAEQTSAPQDATV